MVFPIALLRKNIAYAYINEDIVSIHCNLYNGMPLLECL